MLTIYGKGNRMCDGMSRRNFIQIGALGMGGLTMPQLLQAAMLTIYGKGNRMCESSPDWAGPTRPLS